MSSDVQHTKWRRSRSDLQTAAEGGLSECAPEGGNAVHIERFQFQKVFFHSACFLKPKDSPHVSVWERAHGKHFVKGRQNLKSDWANQSDPMLLASLAVLAGAGLRKTELSVKAKQRWPLRKAFCCDFLFFFQCEKCHPVQTKAQLLPRLR